MDIRSPRLGRDLVRDEYVVVARDAVESAVLVPQDANAVVLGRLRRRRGSHKSQHHDRAEGERDEKSCPGEHSPPPYPPGASPVTCSERASLLRALHLGAEAVNRFHTVGAPPCAALARVASPDSVAEVVGHSGNGRVQGQRIPRFAQFWTRVIPPPVNRSVMPMGGWTDLVVANVSAPRTAGLRLGADDCRPSPRGAPACAISPQGQSPASSAACAWWTSR